MTLDAVVERYDAVYGLATLVDHGLRLLAPCGPVEPGRRHRLRIAAADVSLARAAPDDSTILNILPVEIVSATSADAHAILAVLQPDPDGPHLLARVTRLSWERLGLQPGDRVQAQIKSVALAPP